MRQALRKRLGSPPPTGLGDDHIYAIACDSLGRVWAGHLNHGVSVYNGVRWQNYDVCSLTGSVLAGPIGERVFAITVNPADGDVWIGTNKGLCRYSEKADTWSYYTQAEGLPSAAIQAIAFDKNGTIYVGTACDGLAICAPERSTNTPELLASNALEYKTWRVVQGAKDMPTMPTGEGLPTSLINAVTVTHDGTVWVATTTGLAWSRDHGKTFRFVRGSDWWPKVRSKYGDMPGGWDQTPGGILAEDYITCLAEDPASGKLYVGYRQQGCAVLDPVTMRHQSLMTGPYATAILPLPNHSILLGSYWGGLIDLSRGKELHYTAVARNEASPVSALKDPVPLPVPAKPPTLAELNAMLKEIGSVKSVPEDKQPAVIALDDDWRTQGEWLGRYGRYWACLAAECSPSNYIWGAGSESIQYFPRIGPKHKDGDSLRTWIQWLRTADPRCLEMPPIYLHSRVVQGYTTWDEPRREASWDDHGENYAMTYDGPHIYCGLRIPEGRFYLSLYFVNALGNVSRNRYRDYRVSIRSHDAHQPLWEIKDFGSEPELASTRIRTFYGGAWKRFLIRGPIDITIQVDRNYSFNTNLQAVMLDLVDEYPPPYFSADPSVTHTAEHSESAVQDFQPCTSESEAIGRLMEALGRAQRTDAKLWAARQGRLYALLARSWPGKLDQGSAQLDQKALSACRGTIFYNLNLYSQWEENQRTRGLVSARDIEKALRWDGNSDCSGRGNHFVTVYLANLSRDHQIEH